MHEHDDDLPAALREATRLLRETPAMRDDWLRETQSRVRTNNAGWRTRRWSMSPLGAIAAGLVCVGVGFVAARGVRPVEHPSDAASAPAPVLPAAEEATSITRFDLVAPGAARVNIAGDFNEWSAESLPMRRASDGRTWQIEIRLPPGRYTYGFVVDGQLMRDPSAPQTARDDFGVPNSVRLVSRATGSL